MWPGSSQHKGWEPKGKKPGLLGKGWGGKKEEETKPIPFYLRCSRYLNDMSELGLPLCHCEGLGSPVLRVAGDHQDTRGLRNVVEVLN